MRKYKAKKLIDGYKLGIKYGGKQLVAIPKIKGPFLVTNQDGTMFVEDWKTRLEERKFEDKFGRGEYILGYFEWKPNAQISLGLKEKK